MAFSLGISPLLKPTDDLDQKWLDRDPVDTTNHDTLFSWYDELLADKEVYVRPATFLNRNGVPSLQGANGHFYCGKPVLDCQCCNGVCGPTRGCNCKWCKEIEEEVKENNGIINVFASTAAWAWGELPNISQLKNFGKVIAQNQLDTFKLSASSILFVKRLKARMYVYSRFLTIYSRTCFSLENSESSTKSDASSSTEVEKSISPMVKSEEEFVKSGLTIFFKYTFQFLLDTWQRGTSIDLCSEMVQEAVALFESMPTVLLFDGDDQTKVLAQMVNNSITFLEEAVTSSNTSYLPIKDRKLLLKLLFELVFQTASLANFLRIMMICIKLSETGVLEYAHLKSFMKKFYQEATRMDFDPRILSYYYDEEVCKQLIGSENEFSLDREFNVDMEDADEEKILNTVLKLMKILLFMTQPYQVKETKHNSQNSCEDILVWGNLKLLGSLNEENISIKIATICCNELFVVILTLDGKLFWREHSMETTALKPYKHVERLSIVQITCSYDGHFIALTKDNEVFTWLDNMSTFNYLCMIPVKMKTPVAKLYAGYGYFAVLSQSAELVIWENSLSGRPTHDHHHEQFFPRYYTKFENDAIQHVAFSQYHAEVLLVSTQGKIWSWQDDKLTLISDEALDIVKVYIAKYFYVALSTTGLVWRWGRDRFSKFNSEDMVCLQSVEKLNKQNVREISVGTYHCMALTDSNNVFCWGGLGGKEEEESLIREPVLLKAVSERGIAHVTAGPHQIFCWSAGFTKKLQKKVPFCVDVKKETFSMIYKMLSNAQTYSDEDLKNTMLTSCLTLLKLQFNAAKKFDISPKEIGFDGKEEFTKKLKDLIIQIILGESVSLKMKKIAESVLECGWQFLLPTAEERATTLCQFLNVKTASCKDSHIFILNLLMDCLMQKNGLDSLLEDTLNFMLDARRKNKKSEITSDEYTLFSLLKELFLTSVENVLENINADSNSENGKIGKVVLQVLLRFQRLLVSRVFIASAKDVCWPARCFVYEPTPIIKCLAHIVSYYMMLLQTSCKQMLTCCLKDVQNEEALVHSPMGILMQEFINFLIILQNYAPIITSNCDGLAQCTELLDLYDQFNKERNCSFGETDMEWPIEPGECPQNNNSNIDQTLLTDDDLQNDAIEKGGTKVSEATNVEGGEESENKEPVEVSLESFVGKEISNVFNEIFKSEQGKFAMKKAVSDVQKGSQKSCKYNLLEITYDIEVAISFMLGLHCCYLAHGLHPNQDEINCKQWLTSKLFSAGIDKDTVLRDTLQSTPVGLCVQKLIENESIEAIHVVDYMLDQAQDRNIPVIPKPEHTHPALEYATRSILGVMVWHCGLEKELVVIQNYVKSLTEEKTGNQPSLIIPDAMFTILKMTLKERTAIFQKHQETQKDYAEICIPIAEKCKFLCLCLNPAYSSSSLCSNKWLHIVKLIKEKYNFSWNVDNWKSKPFVNAESNNELPMDVLHEIGIFVLSENTNTNVDMLKKCFLIQIKRTKQRLIAGYLMQSLCLRQHLFQSVQYSLSLGWLGLLVPGGSVSNAKPDILHNVELVQKEDVVKLKEVYRGFENFALKYVFDELESILVNTHNGQSSMAIGIKKSSRILMLATTLLTSSLMSGDIDFLLRCGLLDKLKSILMHCKEKKINFDGAPSSVPFIDECKHKQLQLQEMNGENMIPLMKIGTRVVRGVDWKWDDQDGCPPGKGRLVSDVGEDGWAKVEWDNGTRNSYRMGKGGKYDLKLAEDTDSSDDADKDINNCEKASPGIAIGGLQSSLVFLRHSVTSIILHSLALVGTCKDNLSLTARNVVKKFILNTMEGMIYTNTTDWGSDISIASTFGFIRAISFSKELKDNVAADFWLFLQVKLLNLSLLMKDKDSNGNDLFVKIQLIKQVNFFVGLEESSSLSSKWKRWVVKNIFKLLTRILEKNIYITEESSNNAVRSSMTASAFTTIASEFIVMIRKMHSSPVWCDLINLKLWTSLKLMSTKIDLDTKETVKLFTALSIIGDLDPRVRIGGYARCANFDCGTIANILPNGKIVLYFENSVKARSVHLSKLELVTGHPIDVKALTSYYFDVNVLLTMVKSAVTGPKVTWNSNLSEDSNVQMSMQLYISTLRCLQVLCCNKELLYRVFNILNKEEMSILNNVMENSLSSCPVKSMYDEIELQIATLCLSQEIVSPTKKSLHTGKSITPSSEKLPVPKSKKSSLPPSSHQMLQLLSSMGFPKSYVEYAMTELGENARPEQVVSWLLEHPDIKVFDNSLHHSNEEKGKESAGLNQATLTPLAPVAAATTAHNNLNDKSLNYKERFHLGYIVRCDETTADILKGDIGTVLKVLNDNPNILVLWERLNKVLWIVAEKISVIELQSSNAAYEKMQKGSHVRLKGNVDIHKYDMDFNLIGQVGIIKSVHRNQRTVTVEFHGNKLWEGSLSDLEPVNLSGPILCHGCGTNLHQHNLAYKCSECRQLYLCEQCHSNFSGHSHEFLLLDGVKDIIDEHSKLQQGDLPMHVHQCIQDISVSSNEHMAARMINQELDMPWISEESSQLHWIKLKLHPNVMVTSLAVTLDINDLTTYPSKFVIYGGDAKNNKSLLNTVDLKAEETVVNLLGKLDKAYDFIEIQIFLGTDEKKSSCCKICHLSITGQQQEKDHDQEIINMFACEEKAEILREKMNEIKIKEHGFYKQKPSKKNVKVFCWGLNDKDQLGGLKGSKIKLPTLSENLSTLQCKDLVGGSKTLFCVTYDGKVYACGESNGGRLGCNDTGVNVSVPQLIDALSHTVIKKVAVHSGGRHAVALSSTGEVYSWGDGENGKLGHGDTETYEKPRMIESFVGLCVTDISNGSAHSAAIVNNKDLYTWGLGDYGRLGHGDEVTQLKPKMVQALQGCSVIDVSCGSRDAQTVCLTSDGDVWSWGDGDFGKLGRGGSDSCFTPVKIGKLSGLRVCKILCGAQFTLALTETGTVWTWGKGDFFRLGHNNDSHVREPKCVESLRGKRIVDVAVGALHCLAVSEDGEVYAWGDNDHGQQGTGTTTVNKIPTRVLETEDFFIKRVACGSSHSIAWVESNPVFSFMEEPLLFPINRDPLGANLVLVKENSETMIANLAKFLKEQRLSLVRTVLEITSKQLQQDVLKKMVETLKIRFSRNMFISYLKCFCDHENTVQRSAEQALVVNQFCVERIKEIVNLMKLGVYGHLPKESTGIIKKYLNDICCSKSEICEVLVDVCLRELEEKLAHNYVIQQLYKACVQESSHPYVGAPGVKLSGTVSYPGAVMLVVEFDSQCQTDMAHDVLTFYDDKDRTLAMRTGSLSSCWNTKLKISGEELHWTFTTCSPGGLWGFRFTVTPIPPSDDIDADNLSDDALLQHSSLVFVKELLACDIIRGVRSEATILKLSSLLSMCIQIPTLTVEEKKWMLDHVHMIVLSHNAPAIDVPAILGCSRYNDASVCKLRLGGNQRMKDDVLNSTLAMFINGIPEVLAKQYEFEDPFVRRGDQLIFSPFFRSLTLFACSLGLDTLPCCLNKHQWAWFHKYCTAIRAAQSFIQNSKLPKSFSLDVREKIQEILTSNEVLHLEYENNDLFSKAEDEQLLTWLNRRAQDWSVIWGGTGTVYGWGHNHRGQLGGIEGAKIKSPMMCDSLAALKPVQMAGGEQTLFCVTFDGKVYATGYGNSSRLGLGIVETISTPRMIESLQHISIKKVAVHSGGRHCLALSSDGEVFSWGEGDDGKLGHGNRSSCSHPKLIESFLGKVIINIAAGGSHSAAIGEHGELFTWGRGRYGRLGHGDGEDQLRPKAVETLQNYRVTDVACGSGDAQTLCVTSDGLVWSWGDGDYGKLGRGGSDGCKVPITIEDLTGKAVVKVECGSQFSMALSRTGALYTWGKGDYFRLGHGSEEHVRRPRRVMALESKVITSICCGSLHCVVCTEDGDVYCWGDNDEGQLGNGTLNAGQQPKLCAALQNKKIDCIACGSAHTVAWSTCETIGQALPVKIPVEYNHLQEFSMTTLRNRAFLLNCFSKLFCSCLPLLELVMDKDTPALHGELMINSLKSLILSAHKENAFRKIIDTSMVRNRQHGPVIELNRVKNHRADKGLAGSDGIKSVFGQITSKITEFSVDSFCLPHRTWKVKFIGESVDDCGGGFSESIAEMCEELQNGSLPLLITTPNNKEQNTESQDCLIINPDAWEEKHEKMFYFLGILLGTAIRSGSPLSLRLSEPVWKQLVGLNLNLEDLEDIDRGFVAKYSYLSSRTNYSDKYDEIGTLDLPYTVRSASSKEVRLSSIHLQVHPGNQKDYLKRALQYRAHEFDQQIQWIRTGLSQVVPVPLLSLFTGAELENMVCGNPEIHVEALKSIATYRGTEPNSALVKWFWQILEEFTNHERSLFLRFVWGRTRLPRTAVDFKGKDFIFQALDKYHPADNYLPESYTCFFLLKIPRYSSLHVLREKLKYAIYFCKSIDSDDYARIDVASS